MHELNFTLYGGTVLDWAVALGIAALIALTAALLKPIMLRSLRARAERAATRLDPALLRALEASQLALIAVLALYAGSHYLELPARPMRVLERAATLALFVQVGLWAAALLDFWLRRAQVRALANDAAAATSLTAVGFIGRLVLWTVVVLLALENMGVNITALVAGLGISGIAVALAMQSILGDLFASLVILADKPFLIGDFIVIGDYRGSVEHVGLKSTLIRGEGGEQIIIANGDLLKQRIRNFSRMYERRTPFTFALSYQTSPERLEQIPALVKRIVESHQRTRFEHAHFMRFGESALEFEAVYWVTDRDGNLQLDIQQAINLALMREFVKLGVEFARPKPAAT